MKNTRLILVLFLITLSNVVSSQSTRQLTKDFDGDNLIDTIYIDSDTKRLICQLSSNNYVKTKSKVIRILNFGNTLVATDKGFEFWNNFDRSEFINEFNYDSTLKKMQLIKITRIEFHNGATAGKSTINLLTNQYIGNFRFCKNYKYGNKNIFDILPVIKKKIILPQTNIDTFNDQINYDYEKICVEMLNRAIEEKKINKK